MWPAALTKWGTLNNNSLCGVQCLAALAMTGYFFFRTTSTSTALVALLGLLAAGSRGDGCWEGAGTAVLPWPRVQGKIGGDHLHPPPAVRMVVAAPVACLSAAAAVGWDHHHSSSG